MAVNDEAIVRYSTGKTLVYVMEPGNSHGRNAVAVEKDGKVAKHLPQKCSGYALLLKRGGNVHCTVAVTAVQFFAGANCSWV